MPHEQAQVGKILNITLFIVIIGISKYVRIIKLYSCYGYEKILEDLGINTKEALTSFQVLYVFQML